MKFGILHGERIDLAITIESALHGYSVTRLEPNYQGLSKVAELSYVFICVDEMMESEQLWAIIEQLGPHLSDQIGLILAGSAPVGSGDFVQDWFDQEQQSIAVISWTQILSSKSSIQIILGGDGGHPTLIRLRRALAKRFAPMMVTTRRNTEMIHFAAHAFIATKISFMNEIASLCEVLGAEAQTVGCGIGMDPRIGQSYFEEGFGFDWKETRLELSSLIDQVIANNVDLSLLEAARSAYERQVDWALDQLIKKLKPLAGKTVGVWAGESELFSPLIKKLTGYGVTAQIYSPSYLLAQSEEDVLNRNLFYPNLWAAIDSVDALLILAGHREFREVDLVKLSERLIPSLIIDGRSLFPARMMERHGFEYIPFGRKV
ncbi:hypothetical protein BEP19_11280 [Ammoniphilus oxalaticus]|uniref:UDP-glucose/GDP-mannose dehydrogenase C-terminal domain-containing protein n=1 Tax=Ammoniphilus oxalaticus TaxID=66863 RepID=A0A419SGB2_9BACL|nr:UDP binding domain-containing protein [Ammoniphilus oxalaticus]RKD22820.1 hypothetical protein BEP19_11280 [Ammoniphilus oxalaticus]